MGRRVSCHDITRTIFVVISELAIEAIPICRRPKLTGVVAHSGELICSRTQTVYAPQLRPPQPEEEPGLGANPRRRRKPKPDVAKTSGEGSMDYDAACAEGRPV